MINSMIELEKFKLGFRFPLKKKTTFITHKKIVLEVNFRKILEGLSTLPSFDNWFEKRIFGDGV